MTFPSIVEKNRDLLVGRVMSTDDFRAIRGGPIHFPNWYLELLSRAPLVDHEFTISPELDSSSLGGGFRWYSPAESIEEATEFEPGITALRIGFCPIGSCVEGSGDPYAVRFTEHDQDPALYRLLHDSVRESPEEGLDVELVIGNLSLLFEGQAPKAT